MLIDEDRAACKLGLFGNEILQGVCQKLRRF